MPQPSFIHLRVHSAYSLSEGAVTIKQMAALAAKYTMPALAITDTGNLFGALEYSEALVEKAIQPIIGMSLKVDLAEAATTPQKQHVGIRSMPSLVLLAQTEAGYTNMMRLASRSFLDVGPQDEAHVTWELFEQCSAGVICLSGGPEGPLNEAIVQGQRPLAEAKAEKLKALFGDRFYIELQRHGLDTERAAESGLVEIAYDQDIPLVATNEVYFAAPEDFAAHDALICIAGGEVIATEDRRRLTPEHYFKSQREMVSPISQRQSRTP
jgi:DNA polymerase III subunit alpha